VSVRAMTGKYGHALDLGGGFGHPPGVPGRLATGRYPLSAGRTLPDIARQTVFTRVNFY
jgi:hypothetical protein